MTENPLAEAGVKSRRAEIIDKLRSTRVWPALRGILMRGGPVFALIILSVYLANATPYFMTESNLVNVARRTSVVAIFAIGQTFVILTGGIDLSVGAIGALAASVSAVAMTQQIELFGSTVGPLDFGAGLLVALIVGALAGFINGLLITKGRIPDFIAI